MCIRCAPRGFWLNLCQLIYGKHGDFPVGDNFHYHLNGSSQDSGSSLGCTCSVAVSVISGIHFNGFSGISLALSLPGASFSFLFCTPWVSFRMCCLPLADGALLAVVAALCFSASLGPSSSSSGLCLPYLLAPPLTMGFIFQMVSRTQPKELPHCVPRVCPVIFVGSDQDWLTHVTARKIAQK